MLDYGGIDSDQNTSIHLMNYIKYFIMKLLKYNICLQC
jgi:hypothetical protein